MTEVKELLDFIPEKLFTELIIQKKNNIERRADWKINTNILDSYFNKVTYIDSIVKKIKDIASDNELEIDNTTFNEYKNVLVEYSNLVGILSAFKEEEPWISEIFRSSQWNSFINNFNNWEKIQYNNSLSKLDVLKINLERLLNNLKILVIENKKSKDIDIKYLKKAEQIAKSLLEKKNQLQDSWIKNGSDYFNDLSKSYELIEDNGNFYNINKYKNIWWLIFSIIIWWIVIFIIWYLSKWENLTSGDFLARISIVVVWIYLMITFLKQFENSQKLKDIYRYKKTALDVMIKLKEISSEEEKEKILNKALDTIFLPVWEKKYSEKTNSDIYPILLELIKRSNAKG
jgi:hypothetical protein